MKIFSIVSGMASIASLVIAIYQREIASNVVKVLFFIAPISAALSSYFMWQYAAYKNEIKIRVIPELIHLKGACCLTNEIKKVICSLTDAEIRNEALFKSLRILVDSAVQRMKELGLNNPEMDRAASRFDEKFGRGKSASDLRQIAREAHEGVHYIDKQRLEHAGVLQYVYKTKPYNE